MKFIVDTQLPPRLATWLRAKGHEAIHVEEVGLHEADDPDILRFAIKAGAILITKDRDEGRGPRGRPAFAKLTLRYGEASGPESSALREFQLWRAGRAAAHG